MIDEKHCVSKPCAALSVLLLRQHTIQSRETPAWSENYLLSGMSLACHSTEEMDFDIGLYGTPGLREVSFQSVNKHICILGFRIIKRRRRISDEKDPL